MDETCNTFETLPLDTHDLILCRLVVSHGSEIALLSLPPRANPYDLADKLRLQGRQLLRLAANQLHPNADDVGLCRFYVDDDGQCYMLFYGEYEQDLGVWHLSIVYCPLRICLASVKKVAIPSTVNPENCHHYVCLRRARKHHMPLPKSLGNIIYEWLYEWHFRRSSDTTT